MADSRVMMNIKGIGVSFIPRFFFQRNLKYIFKEIAKFDSGTLENISERVNYCNKLKQPFGDILRQSAHKEKLGKFPFKKTSLAYDGYAISKYFCDDFMWIKAYGDINYLLSEPSVCKDRPICENNENNVLLKLDKNRHFIFLNDKLEFEDKQDSAIFRGACYQDLRKRFMQRHFLTPRCDVGDTARNAHEWKKSPLDKKLQIHHKFILSLEGNTFASNLIWAMSSNSLVIAPKMTNETWLMEGKLQPNQHYALLKNDFSNLEELLDYYLLHPKEALEIIEQAHQYLNRFRDERMEFLVGILVLAKYLFLSEQMELPREIIEFFVLD